MKRIFLLSGLFLSGVYFALGQSCPQTLRLARSTYEQGRLHELPSLLEKCLQGNNFSKQEKVDAYRLLTLAYIYLEEPDKADESMLKLIETDNYFETNNQVDPAEFVALWKTFRTKPVFRVGGKVGTVVTQPNVSSEQRANIGNGEYTYLFGPVFGATFEIPWKERFTLNPELVYSTNKFNYRNTNAVATGDFNTEADQSLNYLSLPLNVQYSLKKDVEGKKNVLNPYVSLGLIPEYLMSATKTPGRKLAGNQPVETKEFASSTEFEKFNLSVGVSAGIKYRFAGGFLIAEARYKYGLLNVNNQSSAYKVPEVAWSYHYIDGVFKLNSLQFTVGYIHNVFNPKKLTVKK